MLGNRSLAKSISDASWRKLARKAIFKAEMLGKHTIFVDPWGTTQFCHKCLHWVPKELSESEHKCPECGEILHREVNSAKLIKRLGILRGLPSTEGRHSPSKRLRHPYGDW
jgi:putative transposase